LIGGEQVDDDISEVKHDPALSRFALNTAALAVFFANGFED